MSQSKLARSPLGTLDDPVGRGAANQAAADWLAAIAPLADQVVGTKDADVLSAGGEGDVVQGLKGDDTLSSTFNRTALFGGKDDDTLTTNVVVPPGPAAADGVAVQFGEDGRDTLSATVTIGGTEPPFAPTGDRTATILLDGGHDDDVISALANVSLFTLANVEFHTEVLGDKGNDRIDVVANASGAIGSNVITNVVDGGAGNDRITASAQTDLVSSAGTVTNELRGGDGNDFIDASAIAIANVDLLASNVLDGGKGDDVLRAFNQVSCNFGAPVSVMQLTGDDGKDVLVAESHNHGSIIATENSRLDGGKDDDVLSLDSSTQPALVADVHGVLLGDSGNDALTARLDAAVFGRPPSITQPVFNVSNLLDGGTGRDSLTASLSIEDISGRADDSVAVNILVGGNDDDQLTAFAAMTSATPPARRALQPARRRQRQRHPDRHHRRRQRGRELPLGRRGQ